jgi:hypothetical protein
VPRKLAKGRRQIPARAGCPISGEKRRIEAWLRRRGIVENIMKVHVESFARGLGKQTGDGRPGVGFGRDVWYQGAAVIPGFRMS